MIPFDGEFAARSAAGVRRRRARRARCRRRTSRSARTSASATGRRATPQLLRADARFETRVVPLLEVDGEVVSSSHIRGLVAGGAVQYAGELLGAPFALDGEVAHGDKRGRDARLSRPRTWCRARLRRPRPRRLRLPRAHWPTAPSARRPTNVGVRPQFETGRGELIEAFLIDWSTATCTASRCAWSSCKRLRGEKRFDAVEALVEQMDRDVEEARALVRASPATSAPHMSTLTAERKQEIVAKFGENAAGHRATPGSRSRCSPSASTISPSTCASTRRTTTRAAACSCSSASAAAC